MYNLLECGAKIIVSMQECISTVFWIEDNTIHTFNRELGDMRREDLTPEKINSFFEQIIRDGGTIEAHTYTNKQEEIYKAIRKRNAEEDTEK